MLEKIAFVGIAEVAAHAQTHTDVISVGFNIVLRRRMTGGSHENDCEHRQLCLEGLEHRLLSRIY